MTLIYTGSDLSFTSEKVQTQKSCDIDAINSTNFNGTLQAAAPVAAANEQTAIIYDPFAPTALGNQVLNAFPKGIVLIVGHSNTTSALLNAMVGANTYLNTRRRNMIIFLLCMYLPQGMPLSYI